jgi:hypothetical protein
VKWFKGQYFQDFSSDSMFKSTTGMGIVDILLKSVPVFGLVLAWCFVATIATLLFATIYYKYSLKPSIIEKYQKLD